MVEHPTQRIEIELAYDGSAVADGTMDVRDLAPAMFAVGNLFEVANLIFNGRTTTVVVSLRATRSGSFDMVFQVAHGDGGYVHEFGAFPTGGSPYGTCGTYCSARMVSSG